MRKRPVSQKDRDRADSDQDHSVDTVIRKRRMQKQPVFLIVMSQQASADDHTE